MCRDGIERKAGSWSTEGVTVFKRPIREQFEQQGHPYYVSVRFCDEGIIDPAQTRRLLGTRLSVALNAPATIRFGVFRM